MMIDFALDAQTRRPVAARGHCSGVPAALAADPDDNVRRDIRRAAHPVGRWARLGTASAARPRHHWRAHDQSGFLFEDAARLRAQYPALIGIGLGGDERQRGSAPFRELYARAAEAGLRSTNHAGETTGPEAIREALEIGSERIGHALSLIQDAELMEEIRRRRMPLELNPSSNVRTGLCANFAAHPLRKYFDAGLLVTVNSDDPAFFGCSIENEFWLAHTEQGFTRDNLRKLGSNSIEASFLPEMEKRAWLERIEATRC